MTPKSFSEQVMIHKDKIYRFALSYLRLPEEAKDATQDVMLKLWEARESLSDVRNIEGWCMRVTRNTALDRIKRADRRLRGSMNGTEPASRAGSPLSLACERDEVAQVKALMTNLSLPMREAFHLRDVEGYSYLEISEMLEMNLSQVKVNIHRARKLLREGLSKLHEYGS